MHTAFDTALKKGVALSHDVRAHVWRMMMPRMFADRPWIDTRADILAGLTVSAVIIPNAMAYTLLVGLPPQMGLYATLAGTALSALWGSSAFVVTGAVGIVSLLTLTSILPFAPLGSPAYITLAITLAVLIGGIQLAAGMLRLGYLARLIPHSVLIGFSTAAALIIAATQIPALLGFTVVPKEHVIDTFIDIAMSASETHALTFGIGMVTLLFLFSMRALVPWLPSALVALVLGIGGSVVFDLSGHGVALVGQIPARLPELDFPTFSFTTAATLLSSAFVIALIGFLETFAIAKSLAHTTRERLSADKELVGQGMANIGAGALGGFPVSGSFSASAVNVNAGARTALSTLVVSGIIFCSIIFLAPLFSFLPKVILAAIVIAAVLHMADLTKIYHAYSLSVSGGSVAAATFLLAFLFKPDVAVIAGIFIALVFLIHSLMFAKVPEVGFDRELSNTLHPVGVRDSVETLPGLLMVRVESSILYANSEYIVENMRRTLAAHLAASDPPKLFVMSFAGVNDIDLSGIEDLSIFFAELREKDIDVAIVYAKKRERDTLRRAHSVIGDVTFLHSIDDIKARYAIVTR